MRESRKQSVFLIYALLALATIIAYEPVRHNDFVRYDDGAYVTENPQVNGGITFESIVWAFTTPHVANWHSLTWLSHMLDCQFFGLNPLWHHLTSLFFHVASALLLFWVLRTMTGAVWPGAFVAAAFALHPLHVESVAWVAERKDVLSGFFWMLTLAAYLRYAERPGIARYLLVFLSLALGLLAKSMLVTLPFVLLLLDYWPLGRFQRQRQKGRKVSPASRSIVVRYQKAPPSRLIAEKVPLFILVTAAGVITFIVQQSAGAMKEAENFSLSLRVSNALVSYLGYIIKMLCPARLTVLYPFPLKGLPLWQPIVSFLVLAGITVGVLYAARRYLLVGWLWYVGTLVPVIGLVQVGEQAMADRYTYLPSIGIFIMVAWGAAELLTKWHYRKIALGVSAGLLLALLVIFTRMQVRYWQNDLALFRRAVEVTENNYIMLNNYGVLLGEMDRHEEALVHFRGALSVNPRYSKARNNIGKVVLKQGQIDEAIAVFTEVLRRGKDSADAHNNLGLAYARKGRLNLAVQHYNEALRLKPNYVKAINNLGIALKDWGRFDEALTQFTEALRIKPNYAEAHNNLGLTLQSQGKLDEAVTNFTKALEIKPDYAEALKGLGKALFQQGKLEEAITCYRKVLQINPIDPVAHNDLGAVLGKQGKLEEAIARFAKALEIRPDYAEAHYNFGIALYSQGKFGQAITHLTEAAQRDPNSISVHYLLAQSLTNVGRTEDAIEHFRETLRLKPDWVAPMNKLALILATHEEAKLHNLKEAVRLAEKACELTRYEQPGILGTLAAAYAAAGRFGQAIETAEKAIKLAEVAGNKTLADGIRNQLQLYKAGKPYRQN